MTKSSAPAVFAPSTENFAYAASIVQTLDGLAAKRKIWESTDFKKANDGLYALLAQCLETFENKFVNESESNRKTLRSELTALLKTAGVKVQKNTSTLNMFVRFVFGSDRKRAHGYAYVLMAALSHKKTAAELPAWIAECGGIEEIKRLMIQSEEAKDKAARLASAHTVVKLDVEQAILSPIATLELPLHGDYAVLLAKPNPDGTTSIIGALSEITEGLFNGLLLRMARQRLDSNDKSAQVNKELQDLLSGSVSTVNQVAVAA
ncbi:hypothetical protein [Zwartia vadi]|uniref:hypothetical protein n=1 Tax=Zwartia vadi TaxID=3058168 RepID=UPI0025B49CFE|nr:hypothetical protein [Zwartia vadi]MDN3988884.1 hypothetical protein [Zwartia vadi]